MSPSASLLITPSTTSSYYVFPFSTRYSLHFSSSSNSYSPRTLNLSSTLKGAHSRPRPLDCSAAQSAMEKFPEAPLVSQDFLVYARAYWVTRSLIAWNVSNEETSICLYASQNANLSMSDGVVQGYDLKVRLEHEYCGLPANVTQKFPHISNYKVFRVPLSTDVSNILKWQLAVASFGDDGKCRNATSLHLPGVLDDIFAYSGPLGAIFSNETVSLYLWAPTAQAVSACFYEDPVGDLLEHVQLKEMNGVWSVTGPRDWENRYYVYEVLVYHPATSQIEKCLANDPYARGLSSDGKRTSLVNIDCEKLKPAGWSQLADAKPNFNSFSDISIYELHIRDFSASDSTVDIESRGGYCAFTSLDSAGIRHLKKLSNAGLTHVHLLPSFHFGTVDDNKDNWKYVDEVEMAKLPPGSDKQQAAVVAVQDEDSFNWGYDPVLWGVPKGSYATSPNGPSRILEFREMVQALNLIGVRVILDVVYNHLYSSGPFSESSVLDKIVPGYYLRRNTDGGIENSTCMNNTASEHFMMERLILDDLLCWAVAYKVDGFRFDLMGHIMKSTMVKAKSVLQRLSRKENGVDGSKIYIYGEGWDFGEVAKNKRGINASQFNLCGTGIGSFNDRIRDAVIGGSPFGNPLQQGFITGLALESNGYCQGDQATMSSMLSTSADHIQVGLAGNLKDFVLTCHSGEARKGSEVLTYDGTPVGYALSPVETINYVSAHDNETLFDIISMKTPMELSVDERCRINHLASSIIGLSQGMPFFHSGDEILRSKSLDRDSYNSGDWFNKLDFSYEANNWGVGLPPKGKNEQNWLLIKPRLENQNFKPGRNHILAALDNFVDILKIRYSSPLFRLGIANSIQERVRFHNTGPSWVPGVIVMSIEDGHAGRPGMAQLDPLYSYIVIIFNASPNEVSMDLPALKSRTFQLHPVQLKSADNLVKESTCQATSGKFTVPRRTTAVFVEVRGTST